VARPSRSSTFIDEGLLARHLRKMRRIYAERHDLILHTLETDFADWLRPIPAVTGIHITAMLRSRSRTFERDLAASRSTDCPRTGQAAGRNPASSSGMEESRQRTSPKG
jgi:GntR family transcriptional regulator/MocR family aminotransferase